MYILRDFYKNEIKKRVDAIEEAWWISIKNDNICLRRWDDNCLHINV